MKTVAILLFPDLLTLDVAGPMDVFSIANRYLPPEQAYRILTLASGNAACGPPMAWSCRPSI